EAGALEASGVVAADAERVKLVVLEVRAAMAHRALGLADEQRQAALLRIREREGVAGGVAVEGRGRRRQRAHVGIDRERHPLLRGTAAEQLAELRAVRRHRFEP